MGHGLIPNHKAVTVNNKPNNPVPVEIIDGTTGSKINQFNEVLSVAASVLTTIQTYTVPVGKTFFFNKVSCSGSNYATYQVEINSQVEDKGRTWWGNFNKDFDFGGLELAAGAIITVKVIHERPYVGDFNSKINGSLN